MFIQIGFRNCIFFDHATEFTEMCIRDRYETYIPSKSGDMYRKIVPASIRKKLGDWAKHQPDKRGLNFLKRNATSVEDSYIGQAFIMDNEEADEVLLSLIHI